MKMSGSVTAGAQRDEILFGIISELGARSDVVEDLKISCCAAILAAPSTAYEHLAG
jgi:hypothetical protein